MIGRIISIGTELLLGEVVNTNASFIARELKNLGIFLYNINTVGDNKDRLLFELNDAYEKSEIIITTGGLGPTKDDMTKEVIANSLNLPMILNEDELEKLKNYFKNRKKDLNEGNISQAYFPKGAILLDNPNGTASGAIIETNKIHEIEKEELKNKIIIILPGPPREMIPMFNHHVLPYLKKKRNMNFVSKTINVMGMGESKLEERLMDLVKNQSNPTIATYFNDKALQVRVMASSKTKEEARKILEPYVKKVMEILGNNVVSFGEDVSIEDTIGKYLIENNITISTAESITGGMLSSHIVNIPGISQVYKGSFITYSNEAKINVLNVNKDTIEKYGAVSLECAKEMAENARKLLNTSVSIATTGIASKGGEESSLKEIGLVYIAISTEFHDEVFVKEFHLQGTRNKIRKYTKNMALDFLRRILNIPIYDFSK